jgi:EmrB/QacA subfamily drug resistance transporter
VSQDSLSARPASTAWALAVLAFAQLVVAIDYNIVYVALPEIGRELGFSAQSLQWVVSAYALAFGGFLLFGGRAADLLGRRRMFVVALGLYGIGSLIGGFAADPMLLVAMRAVQGLGGALLVPATLSLINTTFDEGAARTRAIAIWGAAGSAGLALGSLLGGLLTQWFGWPAVFLVNVPIVAALTVGALTFLPVSGVERGQGFDLVGSVIATVGVASLVFALVQGPELGWTSIQVLIAAGVAVVLLTGFLALQSRSSDPLLPLRLYRNRSHTAAVVVTFVFMGTFGTQYYFFTVYLQDVLEFDALRTGLAFLPLAVLVTLGTKLAEPLIARVDARGTMLIGQVLGAVGMAWFALTIAADGTYLPLLPALACLSLGQGLTWTAMFVAAAAGVAPTEQGVAAASASTSQQVGSAVGLAVLLAIAALGTRADMTAFVDGMRTAIITAAIIAVGGALVALLIPTTHRSKPSQAAPRSGEAVR